MESLGSFLDEEWECLSRMFSNDQDSDPISCHVPFSSEQDQFFNFETPIISSLIIESDVANPSFNENHGFCNAYQDINPNFYHDFSQEICNNECVANDGAACFPYPSPNVISLPSNGVYNHEPIHDNSLLLAQVFSDDSMEETLCMRQNINMENSFDPLLTIADKHKHTPAKRKIEMHESLNIMEDKVNDENLDENPKKKTRVSRDNKTKKKVQPKKKQKMMDAPLNAKGIDGEDTNNNNKTEGNAPIASSSSCSSDDDLNGGAINSNWKTRASRGAATDPQSLYARKRRERINERLKVLQNLVPNGTKVDISTMLEEAVQYVKFLQLQIKLLSSDEMWMYAPIAYNGMDMGLYQKLSQS
ncbi:hypothetical protein R6Q59_010574 [Mikania micrantha]